MIPSTYKSNFKKILKSIDTKYLEIKFSKDEDLMFLEDGDHLNKIGSEVFTYKLKKSLNLQNQNERF